ncbi:FeoB small GTPase domain-containing protein [Desulforudis sp. 1088]|uniref:FeoB small GTPase domain-containing protein n=1 Tax=unclassified Candidatus Desulforudis TaxID=2635950 RepID=UPI003BE6ADBB
MRVFLVGNPNVGKSVLFSCLTGTRVVSANYPGSSVEFTRGFMQHNGQRVEVISVPGIYTLEPLGETEKVAAEMLSHGDLVINVVDATNLERNLYLTLQLLERGIPVIVALNLWDEAQHKGIVIKHEELERLLGVPVVPTAAVLSRGIKHLLGRLPDAKPGDLPPAGEDERWALVGRITARVQTVTHKHHTWLEMLEDASIRPFTGLLMAAAVIFITFKVLRFIGEGLIIYVLDPLFNNYYAPLILKLHPVLEPSPFWHNLLIGHIEGQKVDFITSMGVLTTGLYVPIGMVLPYILAFYLVLGFLEDLGFLPRLAVLLDSVMHSVGMHGYAIIPMILGLGCNVPAALGIRTLESRRQKFIAMTLMVVAIPCFSQTAVVIALVGKHGGIYLAYVFATLLVIWISLGLILNRYVHGSTPSLLIEIPHYRIPNWRQLGKKLSMRLKGYTLEAVPSVIAGIILINFLFTYGIVDLLASVFEPLIEGCFGLPKESLAALIIGFLRKDVALSLLQPLGLDILQLVVASVLLTVYFPCIATFSILLRELGGRDMLKATMIMFATAFVSGTAINYAIHNSPNTIWLVLGLMLGVAFLISRGQNRAAPEHEAKTFSDFRA